MILLTTVLMLAQAPPTPAPRPSVPTGPVVVLETSAGKIRIALDQEKAPLSTANFVKYARSGHYGGTVFHRVIPRFMIQGGGMTAELKEKTTLPPIRNESRNGVRNLRGTVAMARTNDPNSATSQFFINLKDNPFLDFGIQGAGYAVFGKVIEGMDVVDQIAAVPTKTAGPYENVPSTPVLIKSVKVEGAGAPAAKPAAPTAKPASPAVRPTPRRPAPRPRATPTPRP
jgi:peptidyl-prolyl cis-trans isomerase A (cyclophilin A)